MLLYKPKKNQNTKGNRLLISITVMGSAGPIRFVVNEDELVAAVIDTTLKAYAREGRLPVLGSNLNDFFLYCPNAGLDGKKIRNPSLFPIDYRMVFWFILKLITCLKKIAFFFNRLFFPVSFESKIHKLCS
jgi:hypothetical protein